MGRRLKRMQEGVDEVISLINSRHGVGSFDGDIQRIADEAFTDCQFTDEECRHAAWLGFYENFRTLLNERTTQHRCIHGGICENKKAPSAKGASKGFIFFWMRGTHESTLPLT